jgi:hypothetical protein
MLIQPVAWLLYVAHVSLQEREFGSTPATCPLLNVLAAQQYIIFRSYSKRLPFGQSCLTLAISIRYGRRNIQQVRGGRRPASW